MKITVIHCSPNQPSNSTYLGEKFIESLQKKDDQISIESLRLYDLHLELFSLKFYEPDCVFEQDYLVVKNAITSADAILITTPIWNFLTPAALKNLVDRIGSFALHPKDERDALNGKPVFVIFTGGGPKPAWQGIFKKTTSSLFEGLAYMNFTPVGSYFEPRCTKGKDVYGLVVDTRIESHAAIALEAEKFYSIVQTYITTGKLPIYQNYRKKIMKLGETIMKKIF